VFEGIKAIAEGQLHLYWVVLKTSVRVRWWIFPCFWKLKGKPIVRRFPTANVMMIEQIDPADQEEGD